MRPGLRAFNAPPDGVFEARRQRGGSRAAFVQQRSEFRFIRFKNFILHGNGGGGGSAAAHRLVALQAVRNVHGARGFTLAPETAGAMHCFSVVVGIGRRRVSGAQGLTGSLGSWLTGLGSLLTSRTTLIR